jgi:hypothetical protein
MISKIQQKKKKQTREQKLSKGMNGNATEENYQ